MNRLGLMTASAALMFCTVAGAAPRVGRQPLSPEAAAAHHERNSICHKDWRAACGGVAKGHERHVCVRQHVQSYSPDCQAAMQKYKVLRRAQR